MIGSSLSETRIISLTDHTVFLIVIFFSFDSGMRWVQWSIILSVFIAYANAFGLLQLLRGWKSGARLDRGFGWPRSDFSMNLTHLTQIGSDMSS